MFYAKKNIKNIVLTGLLLSIQQGFAEKHIIGSWPSGFFPAFFGVLNQLYWCEHAGKTPVVYWGKESFYWQKSGYNGSFNAWEYYFEPVSDESASEGEPRDKNFSIDRPIFSYSIDLETRLLANRFINSYVEVVPSIKDKIELFFRKKMAGEKTIGIHLRGTDKHLEVKIVDPWLPPMNIVC